MKVSRIKALVRKRDGYRCVHCGMRQKEHRQKYGRRLHVHRLTPGSRYRIKSSITLCIPCHSKEPKSPHGTSKIKLVKIPLELVEQLRKAAAYNFRPVSWEFRYALYKHVEEFKAKMNKPPDPPPDEKKP